LPSVSSIFQAIPGTPFELRHRALVFHSTLTPIARFMWFGSAESPESRDLGAGTAGQNSAMSGPRSGSTSTPTSRRRKLFALCYEIGLCYDDCHDDLIELAQALLWRDITSTKRLDDGQVLRLLDALEGFEKVSWLLRHREQST
jgi:hypothetical protein